MKSSAARVTRGLAPILLVVAMSSAAVGVASGSTTESGLSSYATPAQVKAAVQASFAITSLPSNATPTLATLANNGDWGGDLQFESHCPLLSTTQYSFNVASCYFGDLNSKFTVTLLGDSRSRMMLDVFDVLGLIEGFRVQILAKYGCPDAIATFETNNGGTVTPKTWTACSQFHTYVLGKLALEKPQVIVVASILDMYLMKPTPHVATKSEVQADVLAFLRKLPSASHKIVFGGFPQPAPTANPTVCLSRNPTNVQACTFTLSSRVTGEFAAESAAAKSAADPYVSQLPYFCTTRCPSVIGTIIPYTTDAYHADKTYYNYLTDVIWTLISPTMTKANFKPI